jgi:two-component system, LytTR family, sensor kinase
LHLAVATTGRWKLSSREMLFIFAFWTFLATLSSVNRILDPRGFGFRMISPAGPIALEYIESWLWAAATPLVFWLSSRFTLERSTWMTRIPMLILIGIVMAIAVYAAIDVLRPLLVAPRRAARFGVWRDIANFRFVNELLFYFAILAAGYARVYFLRDREQAAHSARLQAQLAEARLDALRMQINPHFLFNTLHAISAMVDRDPSGVRKMIARLSDLLRHTIESRGTDEIPLRQELVFLDRYIEIMEIRFQGRLRVARTIEEEALDALVPNLILQPIVENALEHGVSRAGESGVVEIGARRSGERLVITVRDNGPGPGGQAPSAVRTGEAPVLQLGVGLRNTRARLEQLHGDAATFSLRAGEGGGAVAEIVLPYRHV